MVSQVVSHEVVHGGSATEVKEMAPSLEEGVIAPAGLAMEEWETFCSV
jgi:hypothetical protein